MFVVVLVVVGSVSGSWFVGARSKREKAKGQFKWRIKGLLKTQNFFFNALTANGGSHCFNNNTVINNS